MSKLKELIKTDMIKAMKDKNTKERDLLRFIMAQIKQVEVDQRKELVDSDVYAIIRREIKQTEDARLVADTEELQWRVSYLKNYLPPQLSEGAIYQLVSEYKIGQPNIKVAMKELMSKYGDVSDRKILSETIRRVYA